jgi:hypothetical protein
MSTAAIILVIALAAQVAAAAGLSVGASAPPFELNDQYNRVWRLGDLRGKVVVVIAVNQRSGEMIRPWASTLFASYGSRIQPLGILDLHTYPGALRGLVAAQVRRQTDRSQPMLLDFKGRTGAAYGVSSLYPVIVVIDRRGVVRGIQRSVWTRKALTEAGGRSTRPWGPNDGRTDNSSTDLENCVPRDCMCHRETRHLKLVTRRSAVRIRSPAPDERGSNR